MSLIKVSGNASGTGIFTIAAPATNTDRTLTLADNSGTILTSATTTGFPAGSVIQVVSANKTDTFSQSSTNTFTDITGLSVAITPTSASSKVLVTVCVGGASMTAAGSQAYRLVRGSTAIGVGTASGSRQAVSWRDFNGNTDGNVAHGGYSFTFLDSPATTSSTTYKLQLIVQTGTGYINRSPNDSDVADPWGSRPSSTITVMEIAA
jgi:acyl-coenzyme A thioesterase PaaI-like protein